MREKSESNLVLVKCKLFEMRQNKAAEMGREKVLERGSKMTVLTSIMEEIIIDILKKNKGIRH